MEARLHAILRCNRRRWVAILTTPNALPLENEFRVTNEQETSEKISLLFQRIELKFFEHPARSPAAVLKYLLPAHFLPFVV